MLVWTLSILSGALIGFVLAVVGGGGSILAVPLLLYVVGIRDPHVAIGTAALAVAANAFVNLFQHARRGSVKWPCAVVFALSGVAGASIAAAAGRAMDGGRLIALFALVMLLVGVLMVRRRNDDGDPTVHLDRRMAPKLLLLGFVSGAASGFFGIGGGFLIVPGLALGTGMAMLNAIASSLLSVGAFGLTTAVSYALHGLVDWPVAGMFILGGVAGGTLGLRVAGHLATRKGVLNRGFAGLLFVTAAYMLWRGV